MRLYSNAGGIRASIDAPEVTRGEVSLFANAQHPQQRQRRSSRSFVSRSFQILTAFPFGNQIVDVSFTGRELWSIFEGIVSDVNSVGRAVTSFVQVSAECAFTYNPNNAVGSRLISLNIGGADIDFERTYTVGACTRLCQIRVQERLAHLLFLRTQSRSTSSPREVTRSSRTHLLRLLPVSTSTASLFVARGVLTTNSVQLSEARVTSSRPGWS